MPIAKLSDWVLGLTTIASTTLSFFVYPFSLFHLVSFSFPDLIWNLFWHPLQPFERVLRYIPNWFRWRTLLVLREWMVQEWWTSPFYRWGAVTSEFSWPLFCLLCSARRIRTERGRSSLTAICSQSSEEKSCLPDFVPLRNIGKVNFHWTWTGICWGLWFWGTNSGSVEIAIES